MSLSGLVGTLAVVAGSVSSIAADDDPPTFHEDVAPILGRHCVRCHRPGALAPMSLLDPSKARGWARMMDEVIHQGLMPPWFADPAIGRFSNEARLSKEEKATLKEWAASGALLGPPPPPSDAATSEAPGWEIGAPDVQLELPVTERIPATGVVTYSYQILDPGLAEDRWIEAVEVRPTDLERTHHVVVYVLASTEGPDRGFTLRGLMGRRLGEYVPGRGATSIPEGHASFLSAGSRLLVQVHYQPNGTPGEDRTQVGLRFARGEVRREVRSLAVFNLQLRLEPHEAGQTFTATERIPEDAKILSLYPRMHTRGASFTYELLRADSPAEPLLRIPRYDYNWQLDYVFAEPLAVRAGDQVRITATFDNSEANPFNPDPSATVTWGEHLWDEVMIGFVRYSVPVREER